MHGDLIIPARILASFVLVMARVWCAMMFVPLPGFLSSTTPVKAMFSMAVALALFPFWPRTLPPDGNLGNPGWFLVSMLAEGALGISIGLLAGFVSEALVFGFQVISLQAGYAYATTVDPTSQAEAGYLPILGQLLAGFFFFAFGVHHMILQALASSLTSLPPGSFNVSKMPPDILGRAAADIFSTGLRLVMPGIALLAMTDILVALIGRINQQLQVVLLAFPLKMLLATAALGWTIVTFTIIYSQSARRTAEVIFSLIH